MVPSLLHDTTAATMAITPSELDQTELLTNGVGATRQAMSPTTNSGATFV